MKKLLGLSLILSLNTYGANLPVITLDENGVEKVSTLTKESYQKSFSFILDQANQAALSLDGTHKAVNDWKLTKFSLGLGLAGTVGLGPWDLGLSLKQRFIFTK
tara:strand:+ start:31508 stop:31819 length:312 start_codon:yes stop_codon:yes gene_type:complete